MSPALANEIVTFTHETDKPVYKATLAAVAQARHVRPVFWNASRGPSSTPKSLPRSRARRWKPPPADSSAPGS